MVTVPFEASGLAVVEACEAFANMVLLFGLL